MDEQQASTQVPGAETVPAEPHNWGGVSWFNKGVSGEIANCTIVDNDGPGIYRQTEPEPEPDDSAE